MIEMNYGLTRFHGLSLRAVDLSDEDDLDRLFRWRNEASFIKFCTPSQESAKRNDFLSGIKWRIKGGYRIQALVVDEVEQVEVGTIYAYDINCADGYASITLFLDPQFRVGTYGIKALLAFVLPIFNFPINFHKLYFDVYAHNLQSMKSMRHLGLKEEGRFVKERVVGDDRVDRIRFAMFRSDVERLLKKYSRLLVI